MFNPEPLRRSNSHIRSTTSETTHVAKQQIFFFFDFINKVVPTNNSDSPW